MGAKIEIYNLFESNDEGSHLLIVVDREDFSNSNEGDYYRVQQDAENRISSYIEGKNFCLIGSMEYLPLGEDIYRASSGDILDIYYCHNTLNNSFIILGTAASKEEFLEEAIGDYGAEVDKENVFKLPVQFYKA